MLRPYLGSVGGIILMKVAVVVVVMDEGGCGGYCLGWGRGQCR